jgi:hypothetical protein
MVWPDSLVTQYQMDADSANPGEELNERSFNSTDNGITDKCECEKAGRKWRDDLADIKSE